MDEQVLQQWADLTDRAPKTSLGAFLTAAAAADKQYGGKVGSTFAHLPVLLLGKTDLTPPCREPPLMLAPSGMLTTSSV